MADMKNSKLSPDYSALPELVRHHIESFDHLIDSGLDAILMHIKPVRVTDASTGTKLQIWFDKAELLAPHKEEGIGRIRQAIYPSECRRAGLSYHGKLVIRTCFQYNNDSNAVVHKFNFGHLPIMLKSKLCHLRNADPKRLISLKEEQTEVGGYFICNGLERLVRVLIMAKRNYPTGVVRKSYGNRGEGYTNKAVVIRCVRDDQSSVTVRLYYLRNGSARLGFSVRAREYLLPVGVVLKALVDTSDREIYLSLTSGFRKMSNSGQKSMNSQLVGERATIMLNEVRSLGLVSRKECLKHIGEYFRPVMDGLEAEEHSLIGDAVFKDFLFVHLSSNYDKFNLLIFMLQKLFALVDETALPDNEDALQNQEVLLPGHLIAIYLKEKLQEWLYNARRQLQLELQSVKKKINFQNLEEVKKLMEKNTPTGVCNAIETMLKTGRLITPSGLDLQQRAGMTIVAERLNFLRFISHFQSVHRGASFTTMRTTTVRKLLPESWGFLCPVHTPDGEPCGLLNHMTSSCRITSYYDSNGNMKNFFNMRKLIVEILVGMGMTPSLPKLDHTGLPEVLFVLLDGRIIGSLMSTQIEKVVAHLRILKVSANTVVPSDLEVGFVPFTEGGAFPGLYLFTSPSRFIRPVRNISCSDRNLDVELIGPFEQAFMEIKCDDGGDGGRADTFPATHEEIHPTGVLSVVANLTPFSDHNQSPRNMYQCQMAKQTMGFSSQAIQNRVDNKLYHLQTPQSPIVRTSSYEKYAVDEFPTGTNAIVAVLAYTGYDMEDAMILNKSSVERGMCHGQIYQVESIDLTNKRGKDGDHEIFRRSTFEDKFSSSLDTDGLPFVGERIYPDKSYYSVYNTDKSFVKTCKLKGSEPATIDYVAIDGKSSKKGLQKVDIRFRRPRNPVIGDKFSSRHGQKGVCSQLWPDIDMPFSGATGMRPDLIINPHAFPSRMTIGMLLESIAAKGGSLCGKFVDATPFPSSCKQSGSSDEKKSLVDELGPVLASKGFHYHGVETLYSGVLGTELTCEIFIGPVYYQRLRHMVSDKYQVRSTGTMDPVTRQPVKGRKVGGGIRFGEMERDSILAHGAAYLLHDRLHTCSDYHIANVCSLCGSILTAAVVPYQEKKATVMQGIELPRGRGAKNKVYCIACKTSKGMETVAMPFVFRYLTTELAAMNIKMTLRLSNRGAPAES